MHTYLFLIPMAAIFAAWVVSARWIDPQPPHTAPTVVLILDAPFDQDTDTAVMPAGHPVREFVDFAIWENEVSA